MRRGMINEIDHWFSMDPNGMHNATNVNIFTWVIEQNTRKFHRKFS